MVKAYGLTDIGKIRESNQDSFAVSVDGALPVWAVVCDGMGGANGGYFASSTAVGEFSHGMDISFEGLKTFYVEHPQNGKEIFKTFNNEAQVSEILISEIKKNLTEKGYIAVDDKQKAQIIFVPVWSVSIKEANNFDDIPLPVPTRS